MRPLRPPLLDDLSAAEARRAAGRRAETRDRARLVTNSDNALSRTHAYLLEDDEEDDSDEEDPDSDDGDDADDGDDEDEDQEETWQVSEPIPFR